MPPSSSPAAPATRPDVDARDISASRLKPRIQTARLRRRPRSAARSGKTATRRLWSGGQPLHLVAQAIKFAGLSRPDPSGRMFPVHPAFTGVGKTELAANWPSCRNVIHPLRQSEYGEARRVSPDCAPPDTLRTGQLARRRGSSAPSVVLLDEIEKVIRTSPSRCRS